MLTFENRNSSLFQLQKLCERDREVHIPVRATSLLLDSSNKMQKSGITENEADESDSLSDDLNYHKPLRRKRSATVSPAAGTRFRHHSKSRFNFYCQHR